jgi:hypothetical protein
MSEHYGSYHGQQYSPPPPPGHQNGLGTAGMVLGIIALVLFFTILVGLICGVLAIIFGVIGRKRAREGLATNGGNATAGLVTGIIAVVITLLFAAIVIPNHYCFHAGTGPDPCVQE